MTMEDANQKRTMLNHFDQAASHPDEQDLARMKKAVTQ